MAPRSSSASTAFVNDLIPQILQFLRAAREIDEQRIRDAQPPTNDSSADAHVVDRDAEDLEDASSLRQ